MEGSQETRIPGGGLVGGGAMGIRRMVGGWVGGRRGGTRGG